MLCLLSLLLSFSEHLSSVLPEGANKWKRVYLATYPKSGNHWLRALIEEATHIATSSVYCDQDTPIHLPKPFPWGGYCPKNGYNGTCRYPRPGEIVVIKTHFPMIGYHDFDPVKPTKTIRVIRHPVDSFYSLFIQEPPQGKVPQDTMQSFLSGWKQFQHYWDKQPDVYSITYEDLYKTPAPILKKVLKAIGYSVTDAFATSISFMKKIFKPSSKI
jgi:hypothetical protein